MRRIGLVIYEKSRYFSDEKEGDALRGLSPFTVRALHSRGAVTDEEIERFLHPEITQLNDPFLFNDMKKAVSRIDTALKNGEKICVFGDYDVDGICATAMLTDYLRSVGANVCLHIPSRRDEGYGITKPAADKLKAEGVQLIITVDNGISAAPEIDYCMEAGMDVIVTDHHLPPEKLPECGCIICHTLKDTRYPDNILCGAGIAFKLIQALAGIEKAMKYVSLAALATIADVVPLVGENRVLTYYGLKAVNEDKCCLGLKRLLESIPTARKPYSSFTVGFAAAPRLNASGRMKDASLAAELFLSDDEEKINRIISELNGLNELRQREELKIFVSARECLKKRDLSNERALLLSSADWNPGVIGIAASRISEMYHRPTILFSESDGFLKGSGRSVEGINLYDALKANERFFIRYGGHAKAAGLTMKAENLEEFRACFNEYLKNTYDDEIFAPRQYYEFETELCDITPKLVSELSQLAPFGEGNPFPVFRTKNVHASRIRRFGNEGRHIRMELEKERCTREAVWFSSFENFEKTVNADSADILYTAGMNHWNGMEKLQLRLECFNSENPQDPENYIRYRLPQFLSSFVANLSCCPGMNDCSAGSDAERAEKTVKAEKAGKTENSACRGNAADGSENKIQTANIIDIENIGKDYLSGTLILVNTPAAAVDILTGMQEKKINDIELCVQKIPSGMLPCAVVLIAPVLSELPENGFAKVICYDMPPAERNMQLIKERMPNTAVIVNSEASPDYGALASQLDCSRKIFSVCYKAMRSLLSLRGYSFAELVRRLEQTAYVTKAQAEFTVSVFYELGFIRKNKAGSLANEPHPRENALTNSVLYTGVLEYTDKCRC